MDLMEIVFAAGIALSAYLIGGVPFGWIIGRAHGVDIRTVGSCNIGATNVTRVIGPWWGKLCFLCDFLKGFLPTIAVRTLIAYGVLKDPYELLPALVIFFVVAGHIWPVYLKFRGGKGVATAAGSIAAVAWISTLFALALWVVLFKTTRYVSLASIVAAAALPVAAIALRVTGVTQTGIPALILFLLLGALTILKHKSNIRRLLDGTENRFGAKK